MNVFVNDYNDLCHEKVWEKLNSIRDEANIGYGFDSHCERARELIKDHLKRDDLDIHFVPGGTVANVLALVTVLKKHEAIIAPSSGHIVNHEVGAVEALGHKVCTIPTEDGKIDAVMLEEKIGEFGDFFNVLPKIVYISNTTETGLVYTKAEIKDIYKTCMDHGLYLYIDGARLASALTSKHCDITFEDMPKLCDAFSIGGTKNGAVYGEALVLVDDDLKENFHFFMKQRGVLMSKGFVLGAQFEAFFEDDLYFQLGRASNEKAELLTKELENLHVDFLTKPQSNQIFIILEASTIEKLKDNNMFELDEVVGNRQAIRLCTSYRTKKEEITGFVEDLKNYYRRYLCGLKM